MSLIQFDLNSDRHIEGAVVRYAYAYLTGPLFFLVIWKFFTCIGVYGQRASTVRSAYEELPND